MAEMVGGKIEAWGHEKAKYTAWSSREKSRDKVIADEH